MGDQVGTCDECVAHYDVSSRDGRCGDCGNCSDCCNHEPLYAEPSSHYFSVDGSYGDAEGLVVVDTTYWTEEDFEEVQGSDYGFPDAVHWQANAVSSRLAERGGVL